MNEDNILTSVEDHISLARFKYRIVNWVKTWINGLFGAITATADATHSATPTITPTYQNGVLTLAFSGLQGAAGQDGADGQDGQDGTTYTPSIGNITTVAPGTPASASVNISGTNAVFNFSIPRGADGQDGTSVKLKPSAAECSEVGDSYIDANGHIQIYNGSTFTDGGVIRGPKGDDGNDGETTYVYIRFAPNNTPTSQQIHPYPQPGDKWIGFEIDTTSGGSSASDSYENYTWSEYVGKDGQDGQSPIASVSKSGSIATISITDKNGTTTAQVSDGADGQDGGIVSKAYRFAETLDFAGQSTLTIGGVTVNMVVLKGDARVTINNEVSGSEYADLHLTLYGFVSDPNYSWQDLMDAYSSGSGAYDGGSSCLGEISGVLSNANLSPDYPIPYISEHKDNWYGVLNILHPHHWTSEDKILEERFVLDIHGVMEASERFEDIFTDDTQFELEII